MKSYSHIISKLYNTPWLITPSVHKSMCKQLAAHLDGKLAELPIPFEDPDEKEEMPEETPTGPDCNASDVFTANGIMPICVDGVIGKHLSMMETACGGVDLDEVCQQLKAAKDPSVLAAFLKLNTPGGTVTGIPETAALIRELAALKPVIAYTDTMACSAGYWLMSQCTYAFASPSSDVGSINVYMLTEDDSQALAKAGIVVNAISGSNGTFKLAGASFKPMTDDERSMFQADINRIETAFFAAVTSKRNVSKEDMQGQVFDGETAAAKNLIDGTADSQDEVAEFIVNNLLKKNDGKQ